MSVRSGLPFWEQGRPTRKFHSLQQSASSVYYFLISGLRVIVRHEHARQNNAKRA